MMTMVTNDYSDVVMLPLATYLSGQIWLVLEDTKLFLIPFIVLMLVAIAKARKQGVDEGSSAIQAYKSIEVGIISMFVVVLFACKPLSSSGNISPQTISVKNFSCLVGNGSVIASENGGNGLGIFNGVDKASFMNNPYVRAIPKSSPSLMAGIMNQIGIGLTNASIASLPCTPHLSLTSALATLSTYEPQKSDLKNLVKDFNKQCYTEALGRKSRDLAKTNNATKDTDLSYNSQAIQEMYRGKAGGVDGDKEPMYLKIDKDDWTGSQSEINTGSDATSSFFDYNKGVISCSDAAREIQKQIDNDVVNGNAKEAFKAISIGDPATTRRDNNTFLYNNIASDKGSFMNTVATAVGDGSKDMYTLVKAIAGDLNSDNIETTAHVINGVFSSMGNFMNTQKVHNYQMIAPLVISIIKAVLIISIPLILFFTGYSGKALLTVIIAYFAIDFSRFFLELGNLINEVLLSMRWDAAKSESAFAQSNGLNAYASITMIGQYVTYTLAGLWYMFVGWMGVKMIAPMEMASQGAQESSSGVGKAADIAATTAGAAVAPQATAASIAASGAKSAASNMK